MRIRPEHVISTLKKHILADGFHIVADMDKSHDAYIIDSVTGKEYLDCYSQFASQPLGWNHPSLLKRADRFSKAIFNKIANSDMYTQEYAEFVDTFADITPDFSNFFFIEGGTLAVENALKAAFNWKGHLLSQDVPGMDWPDALSWFSPQFDVIHFEKAFHGRSGYCMSLTNTGHIKTGLYPKFEWTRLPLDINVNDLRERVARATKRDTVAAAIVEPIQAEGGDIHLSKEIFQELRALANEYRFLLIFDEIQTGMGFTGKWWCYEHFNVIPDMICFGKKTQVCGFCATDDIKTGTSVFDVSGRINSTWGGNLMDMIRATLFIEIIKEENLIQNAANIGEFFFKKLLEFQDKYITNVRGRGLMLAFDLPNREERDKMFSGLVQHGMLPLKCGDRTIRFRPHLTFNRDNVEHAVSIIRKTLA